MSGSNLHPLSPSLAIGIGPEGSSSADYSDRVIVFDVLRAGATLCTLLELPIQIPLYIASEIEPLTKLKERSPHALLIGERNAIKIPGFDFGNSPTEISNNVDRFTNKTILFTSSSGARTLTTGPPDRTLIGSLTNLAFLRDLIAEDLNDSRHVTLIAASGDWSAPSMEFEDLIAILWLVLWVCPEGIKKWPAPLPPESELDELKHCWDWFRILARTRHGKNLMKKGFGKDIAWIGNHFNKHRFSGIVKRSEYPDVNAVLPFHWP